MTRATDRDNQAVLRFIERFASAFAESGMPRMPARVFVALLTDDDGTMTAAELADLLRVSPAAISGAVRYLAQVNMVSREREAGSRRDVYRVYDDVWYEALFRREQAMGRWDGPLKEGIHVLGDGTPAGQRIAETLAFFEFMHQELPTLLGRWRTYRAERFNS
ncbi:GbsR/MarR family transcriptional regulator [Saccharothrix obliqua]|uniref:GbsR/MarR family transcriptional regulator n=1 Tax=Saccharothrix obliqua TaxID=2861747 RepID=UPI001C602C51|nr:MarR family transcriptional regulator [Saccharothrix obliqua]MBW4717656.1 MarR family transcriptional regulator [Saccharothrix obliqua]